MQTLTLNTSFGRHVHRRTSKFLWKIASFWLPQNGWKCPLSTLKSVHWCVSNCGRPFGSLEWGLFITNSHYGDSKPFCFFYWRKSHRLNMHPNMSCWTCREQQIQVIILCGFITFKQLVYCHPILCYYEKILVMATLQLQGIQREKAVCFQI